VKTSRLLFLVSLLVSPDLMAGDWCLRVWRDDSRSMSEEAFEATVTPALETIRTSSVPCVEVVRFGGKGRRIGTEPIETFSWGRLVVPPPETAKQQPRRSIAASLGLAGAVVIEEERAQATRQAEESKHQARVNQARAEHARKLTQQMESLRSSLLRSSPEPAPCTPFRPLNRRIAAEGRPANVIFTDGWTDCHDADSPGLKAPGSVVIVLLPRNRDDPSLEDQLFDQRKKALSMLFPAAKIIAPYELPTILAAVLKGTPSAEQE